MTFFVFLTVGRTKGRSAVIFFSALSLRRTFHLNVVELWIRGSLRFVIIMDVMLFEGVQRAEDHHLISCNSALSTDHRNWMH